MSFYYHFLKICRVSFHFLFSYNGGGLTLAGCQVPTQLLYPSPPQQDKMGRK